MDRQALIDRLAQDAAAPPRWPVERVAALWLALSALWVAAVTLWTGDLRPGWAAQLGTPRFALECGLGLVASLWAGAVALALSVPGRVRPARARASAGLGLGVWLLALGISLLAPALEASPEGMRAHCSAQVLAYSGPPLLGGLWLARRRAALWRGWSGALLGAAAGGLPAVAMQLGCMYDPIHGLVAHVGPAALAALVGAAAARASLPRV